ncbi:hypothetical protein HY090_02135 [Candidatus Kaiserbacteria bacterium]|nr:hypothetical protein [Candidatus Kaiserbacteria bacterium]
MLIVSNYLLTKTDLMYPDHTVVRVNIAWIKSKRELVSVLEGIDKHHVYLDYPQGRTKPPKPILTLDHAIEMANRFSKVKYFAVSNVEDPEAIYAIRLQLPKTIELIPKIETKKGVENLEKIFKKIDAKFIMLDKEDLYLDIKRDSKLFEKLIGITRKKGKKHGVKVLELHGVVFK